MNAPSDSAPTSYPPDPHLLRDLNLWVEEEREGYRAGLEITPWLCQRGGVRAGVLATLVDVISGEPFETEHFIPTENAGHRFYFLNELMP